MAEHRRHHHHHHGNEVFCDHCGKHLNGKQAYEDNLGIVHAPVPMLVITCSVNCRQGMKEKSEKHKEQFISCQFCGKHKSGGALIEETKAAAARYDPEIHGPVKAPGEEAAAVLTYEATQREVHKSDLIDGTESIEWNPFKAVKRGVFGSLTTNPGAVANELVKRVDSNSGTIQDPDTVKGIQAQGREIRRLTVDIIASKWKISPAVVGKVVDLALDTYMREALSGVSSVKQAKITLRSPSFNNKTLATELAYIIRHAMTPRGNGWTLEPTDIKQATGAIVYDVIKRRGQQGFDFLRFFFLSQPDAVMLKEHEVFGDEEPAPAAAPANEFEPTPEELAAIRAARAAKPSATAAASTAAVIKSEAAIAASLQQQLQKPKAPAPVEASGDVRGFDFR